MRRRSALIGSGMLLAILIAGVSLTAYEATPAAVSPPSTSIVASTTSTKTNVTNLVLTLTLPNGSPFHSGVVYIGPYASQIVNGSYLFQNVNPGTYLLNLTGLPNFFMPTTTLKLSKGINFVNETIYPHQTIFLIETAALSYNGTQPGPPISVANGSAVTIQLFNNTTNINDFAIVRNIGNTSESNVLFNSLSQTLSPGGSTNMTFIVTEPGFYYYTSLIGSQSKDGQYGLFNVSP